MMAVTAFPSKGKPRIIAISCMVMVASPHGKWKECVSGLHRSMRAVKRATSIAGRSAQTIRASGSNPADEGRSHIAHPASMVSENAASAAATPEMETNVH